MPCMAELPIVNVLHHARNHARCSPGLVKMPSGAPAIFANHFHHGGVDLIEVYPDRTANGKPANGFQRSNAESFEG